MSDTPADPEPLTLCITRVELHVSVGKWRGRTLVGEAQSNPQQPLLLFAKDDEQPLPWGRALEELLQEILQRVREGG